MARYTGPACRLCRRLGEKLMLKGERCTTQKCALERRKMPPGQQRLKRRRKKNVLPWPPANGEAEGQT